MSFIFTDENFDNEAVKANELVMVDFYADWCGPCKMMAPIVDEIAKEMDGVVKVGKLNVDNSPETARAYSVMNIPTFIFLKDGVVVDKVVGGLPKEALIEKINAHK